MWDVLPLRRLVDPKRPITYGIVQAGEDVPGGVPYIRPVDMTETDGVADPAQLRKTSLEIARAYKRSRVTPGDLVVSIGPSYGKIMTVPAELDGANLTQGTARVAPGRSMCGRFLFWALQSKLARSFWDASVGGATFRSLNLEPLSRTACPAPDLEEQRRIADFLDAETSRLDQTRVARSKQIDLLNERHLAAVSELVTPGISTDCRRSTDWPWLPAAQEFVRLGHIARVQTGVMVNASRKVSESDVVRPYLRVANVQDGRIDLTQVKSIRVERSAARLSTLQFGDVVITEANGNPDNLGRGAVWRNEIPEMIHQNHIFAIRPDPKLLSSDYLAAVLASVHGRRYFRFTSNQVGIATTSSAKVMSLPVPALALEAQLKVVNQAGQLTESQSYLASALDRQLLLLSERRQALITAAVTGQLDVTTASSGVRV
ncbi:restriction endonuclease subunit S [Actinopolymorpha rutila]|uniref:Type I restriction enzyme S subunit n=1 Tax=Actinopolymorpha rutila TaxID=446787 RepID=A0A852Z4F8_9ACTN|nr:restriction endonuclease subunit S [Actinopolymorpha rutila]NYH87711.1 type I restriction enzyme S subunit [Actinopolymorpha rutila]